MRREALRLNVGQHEPMFKLVNDPRVPKVGQTLRKSSIDGLPDFFDGLGGSISLAGPRLRLLDDVNHHESGAFRRLALKLGMARLFQVAAERLSHGERACNWTSITLNAGI